MKCPKCGCEQTAVRDSRLTSKNTVRRRRLCLKTICGHRWSTYEREDRLGVFREALEAQLSRLDEKQLNNLEEFIGSMLDN